MFADVYDANAESYRSQADRLLYKHLARPLAEALAPLPGPVLDVAGGTGALGRLVGASVTLDISARQLRHHPARHRIHGDAERLPFRSDSFGVAGCAFGINHFPDAVAAVLEMARVAPVVGLLTWRRPDPSPYLPRQVVESLARPRACAVTKVAEELGMRTGSVDAVRALLAEAGLKAQVQEVAVDVPWPGPERFVDYRLDLALAPAGARDDVRRRAVAAIAALDPAALRWRPRLVLGVGRRRTCFATGARSPRSWKI
jgi:ubiquinone/menaquinone biosynthesis C-methylase UbiE